MSKQVSGIKVANECSNLAYKMRVAIKGIEKANGYKSLPMAAKQYLASAVLTLESAAKEADDLSNYAGEIVTEALEDGKCRLRPADKGCMTLAEFTAKYGYSSQAGKGTSREVLLRGLPVNAVSELKDLKDYAVVTFKGAYVTRTAVLVPRA